GHDIVMEIDWQGARQIRAHYADTFSVFILPPSLKILRERLERRAQDSKEVINSRMQQAMSEAKHFNEYDYVIVNDDFDRASAEFISVLSRSINESEVAASRELVNKTLKALGLNNRSNDE
ncbi:MAG: guanylate kinase, partial [Gammaproteobacteria bacterium]|nr:guanylate kinase [Gammaproteobacteria bacterium]